MTERTFRFKHGRQRVELYVRQNVKQPYDGLLDTNLVPITTPYATLTMSVGEWLDHRESCFGQCHETVEAIALHLPEPDRTRLLRVCEIWREYHLNDMQAGTAGQRQVIRSADKNGGLDRLDWYDSALRLLREYGLETDRGYTYGHKWLVRRLPAEVCAELETLLTELAAYEVHT